MKELLPCQFCGNEKLDILKYQYGEIMIHCVCGASQGLFPNRQDAINSWNTRPTSPPTPSP